MERDRVRLLIGGIALVLAALVLLFPPWTARAIRTTTRFAAVADVAPATLVDTIAWNVHIAPLFAPPRGPLPGTEMRELAARAQTGDTAAKRRLIEAMDPFERRVRAPEVLRTRGELWRDSVLAAAGMPSTSYYDVAFALDDVGIFLRLAAVVVVAAVIDGRRAFSRSKRRGGAEDHKRAPARA